METAMLEFYTNPMSRGQIARWALEEAGADYKENIVAYGAPMKSDAYLAINPMGKVPAIRHDGQVVTESAAICAYLADAFPQAGLAPAPGERASYYRWMFFGAGALEAAVINRSMGFEASEEQGRMLGYGNYDLAVKVLEAWLSDRLYVCGDRFTMADVYVGAQVDWGIQFDTLPERDAFIRYAERVRDRDPYRKAKARDQELMAAMQEDNES
jgi:glutathione S-transferase